MASDGNGGLAARIVETTDERYLEVELLHRVPRDLLNATDDRSAAERHYRQAIAVAERQSARLFQLRASTSLAHLWRDQGKCSEARELLGPVDAPDLKDAKALLESPTWRHVFRGLAREHTLIRYDARGNGMSDWDVDELSLDALVSDLETVVDAVGVDRFPLLGISQGCAISVAFAVRHPERVSHLVLYGGFAVGGKKRAPAEKDRRGAMTTLMRLGWGMDNPSFRQMFTRPFHSRGNARAG
jgi:hypothetical protein